MDEQISRLIQRPATPGHIGEFVAAAVFDIALHPSAVHKGTDGAFRSGPLKGRSVNIKLYGKQEGILDIREDAVPDYYLVLTGPRSSQGSSRGTSRPLTIEAAYLFEGPLLAARILSRGSKLGAAASVPQAEWAAAEVWPTSTNRLISLTYAQSSTLALFADRSGA